MARAPKPPAATVPVKKHRASTTGKAHPKVDMTNWRVQIRAQRVKFDDDQKKVYLRELAKHGMKGRAAEAAGVLQAVVKRHTEIDPDFEEAYNRAIDRYRDRVHNVAQKLSLEGVKKPIIGGEFRDEVVAHETIYATNILAMEMRRVDPAWRDKTEATVNLRGGVLVAPAEVRDLGEWAALYAPKDDEKPSDA